MNTKSKLAGVLFAGLIGGLLIGYGVGSKKQTTAPGHVSLSGSTDGACSTGTIVAPEGALFEFAGKSYRVDDFSTLFKGRYFEAKNESYQKESGLIDELALVLALSLKKEIKVDLKDPPKMQELLPSPNVTDEEVTKFYNENKGRLPPGTKVETIKGQIKKYLANQGVGKIYIQELAKLKKEGKYRNFLVRPIAPEISINTDGQPSIGPNDAKITLIEASDYTCGHCKRMHSEVKEVLKKYGKKIKFVQMNFALQPHGLSGKLIVGAYCAQKQGVDKFWKYHNIAFEHEFETKDFNADSIAKLAKLDMKKFEVCKKDKTADDYIHQTNEQLSSVGVNGTPSFFLNNKKLVLRNKTLEQAVVEAMGL
ncbi:MAG: hypothetical protein DRQ88_10215 [Epsilonproteobacteria bacterium]|nr:MAG: hypothetical protein DRQ89_02945 [Campylobacterota bacterium]RLA64854.1 MAG: hypothetical protein DRQ88_10215 [Campylobacterota bacterium]